MIKSPLCHQFDQLTEHEDFHDWLAKEDELTLEHWQQAVVEQQSRTPQRTLPTYVSEREELLDKERCGNSKGKTSSRSCHQLFTKSSFNAMRRELLRMSSQYRQ